MTERASDERGAVGLCARHPDRTARSTCTRCGNFACVECLGDVELADGRCEACRERDRPMPWERPDGGPFWRRYLATVRPALSAPGATFGQRLAGPVGPAASFGLLSSAIGFAPLIALLLLVVPLLLVMPQLAPDLSARVGAAELATFCGVIPCAMVLYPGLSFVYFTSIGLLLHGTARLLGGRASLQQSMRAAYYSSAWEPISAATMAVYVVPILGALIVLAGYVGSAVWRTIALSAFVERSHQLSRGASVFVAAVAAGLWILLLVGSLAAVVGLAVWRRFGS